MFGTFRRAINPFYKVSLNPILHSKKFLMTERAGKCVKPGKCLVLDDKPHKILKIIQGKRGKGGGYVRAFLKDLIDGQQFEKTFQSDELVTLAELEREPAQFSWSDGINYVFLHSKTFEEIVLKKEDIPEVDYLLEGLDVKILKFGDQTISCQIPTHGEYVVEGFITEKETKTSKLAILNSGAQLEVPSFIDLGMKIKVNTETEEYMEKVNK